MKTWEFWIEDCVDWEKSTVKQRANFIKSIQKDALIEAQKIADDLGDSYGAPSLEISDRDSAKSEGAYTAAQRIHDLWSNI